MPNAKPVKQFVRVLFTCPNLPTITHDIKDNADIKINVIEP